MNVIHEDVENVSNENINQVNEGGGGCWWGRVDKLNGVVREGITEKVKKDLKEAWREEL